MTTTLTAVATFPLTLTWSGHPERFTVLSWWYLRHPHLESRAILAEVQHICVIEQNNTNDTKPGSQPISIELDYYLFPQVTIMPTAWEKLPMRSSDCILSHSPGRTTKGNFQGPLPNVSGSTADAKQPKTPDAEISEQPGSHEKPETTSQEAEPVCVGHFHNRHVYQQQLIEKQKKKLKEQQKTIQKLKENQRLAEARWAAERAASVTEAQSHLLSNPRGAEEPQGTCQRLLKYASSVRAL